MEKRSDEVWRKLYIYLYCSWHHNVMLLYGKYSRTLSVPKMLLLWKDCKSTWESAAVKGESCSCWGNQWRGCLASKLNGILARMLDLTHQALQKDGECICAHGVLTSQEDGASCRAVLGSSGYECHLLGDEPLYINYTSFIHMHVALVFTYICNVYVCAYLHTGVQLFLRHVLGWTCETLLRPEVPHLLRI